MAQVGDWLGLALVIYNSGDDNRLRGYMLPYFPFLSSTFLNSHDTISYLDVVPF
jgi:hypothetical protein